MLTTRNRSTEARRRHNSQILSRIKFLPGNHVGPLKSPKIQNLAVIIFGFLLESISSKSHLNSRAVSLLASQRVTFSLAVRSPSFRRFNQKSSNSHRVEIFRSAPLEVRCYVSTKELHCLESLAEDILEQFWTASLIAASSKPLLPRSSRGEEYFRYQGERYSATQNAGQEPWITDSVEFGVLRANFLHKLPMMVKAVMA